MNRNLAPLVVAAAAVVHLVLATGSAAAQARKVCQAAEGRCITIRPPNLPHGPAAGNFQIPRTRDGRPDFTGVWAGPGFGHQVDPDDNDQPIIRGYDAARMSPLTPLGRKEFFRPTTGDVKIDDPIGLCLPYGFTSQIFSPYAQQWLQSDKWLVIRHEFMNNFTRVISLDGRQHPKDADLTWGGRSVGRWEGDTLMIDTVGLKEWWLDNPHPKGSLWHSDAVHVIERVKYIGPRVVSYEVAIDDPKYFTKPWSEELQMVLHPTWELMEFVCEENDRCSQGNCTPADVQRDDIK
jgi:hypothetical protein